MPRSLQAMCVAVLLASSSWTAFAAPPLARLQLPPGFHVALYCDQVSNARGLGPDGKLYGTIGAPCNICNRGPDYARIVRMSPDGSDGQAVASGVRSSGGFDWQPGTHALWFTNDTLNCVDTPGQDFGYPYCHAGNVLDPEFGYDDHACSQFAQPALRLGAHVASLGMRFYVGRMFPAAYQGAIFIAGHGSWNRSRKAGYRVVVVHIGKDGRIAGAQPFVTGFLDDQQTLGRRVDVQPLRDGSLLV